MIDWPEDSSILSLASGSGQGFVVCSAALEQLSCLVCKFRIAAGRVAEPGAGSRKSSCRPRDCSLCAG